MTRTETGLTDPNGQAARNCWRLQDAKARFSGLVRMAHGDGPRHVTWQGRDAVVVVDEDGFNRLQGTRSGDLLVEALRASPHRQAEIRPGCSAMPVRRITS